MVRHQGLRKESDMKNLIGRDTEILNASLKITDAKLPAELTENPSSSEGEGHNPWGNFTTFKMRTFKMRTKDGLVEVPLDDDN